MDDFLEHLLAESLNGRVVPKFELPREHETHAVHAALAKGIRESKRFALIECTRKDETDEPE